TPSMDARLAVLRFLLLVLVLYPNPAAMAENCGKGAYSQPFCFDAWCKALCWMKGALIKGGRVKDSRCYKTPWDAICVCTFCKK
uniref:Knottin scorpion toxin-like domain-containing protein n=1 Tax=Aegilops tauschii subsp. strangulata TaxID=200361 RepID=A0A453J2X3_AEGTS